MANQNISITRPDGTVLQFVIIDRGNGQYTSMAKTYYDSIIASGGIP